MADSTRVLIHGASGRVGAALLRLAAVEPHLEVIAAVSRTVGQRVVDGVARFTLDELASVPPFDVAIDFSAPSAFDALLALCVERKAAFVSGTTGLAQAQHDALVVAAAHVPVLLAANFSLGVAVLAELVERAARALPGWDCDIVESHHAAKVDAPSGTALALGEVAIASGASPRYASLRAGDIVGEHLVQFTALGERIELVHRATNRDIFARGALQVATRIGAKGPGLYRVRDFI